MRRNPALAAIILCVASLRLAAQTSEGISAGGGQSEPSPQQNALGQRNVPAHENERLQEPENRSQRVGSERPVPELLTEASQRPAMRLKDFEDLALANNPTLKQANEIVQRSAGQARQAGLYPNPSLGFEGGEIRGGAYGGGELGPFVQQTIVLGGKLGLRRRVFEAQRREDQLGASEQRYRLLSDVTQEFYSALAAQEVVKLRRDLLKIAQDAVETAHQLANVGQADAPDLLQAEVEAEQAKVEYVAAQGSYLQVFNTLAAVAGKPELPASPVEGSLDDWPRLDSGQIIETILRECPSVKRAQEAVARAEAELRSAHREAVPDLQLRAGLQQNRQLLEPEVSNTYRVGLQGFVTAGVNIPVFNRNQGNTAAAKAELAKAQEEVTRVQLLLRRMAQPLLQAYLTEQVEAERYKSEMIPRAARAYQLYLDKYRQMASAYPQVIISQRTLFQLRLGYIQTLENLWKSAIALQNFTLSGGLDAPAPSGNSSTTINLPNSSGGEVD